MFWIIAMLKWPFWCHFLLTNAGIWFRKMLRYTNLSIVSFTCINGSGLLREKQPHTIELPPPNFIDRFQVPNIKSLAGRRTLFLDSFPNKLNLLSIQFLTTSRCTVAVQLMCSLVCPNWAFRFFFEIIGFLHALREKRLFLSKRRSTVLLLILFFKPNWFLISETV